MNISHLMKSTAIAVIGGILLVASAQAQSVSFGTTGKLDLGDVKAGHASEGNVGIKDGNLTANGSVADGLRIGSNTAQTGVQGAVSAPANVVRGLLGR